MKALLLGLLLLLSPDYNVPFRPPTTSSTCAASPSTANCLYYQDFETGGATTDCTAEDPVMSSGGDCAYTTSPAPLDGSQSANVNDLLRDESAFTGVDTIYGYMKIVVVANGTDGGDVELFRFLNGASTTSPRIRLGSRVFPDQFRFRFYCDEEFDGEGISYTAESNLFGGADEIEMWWNLNRLTQAGELKVVGGSECPTAATAGCTLTCDGDGAETTSAVDGFSFPASGTLDGTYIVDTIILDDVGVPNQP